MADWIKMRTNLSKNTKTILMVDFLSDDPLFCSWWRNETGCECNVTPSRRVVTGVTVAALLDVWGVVNNEIHDDEIVSNMRLNHLDVIASFPSFGLAMQAAGWVFEMPDGEGLIFPNFNEFNTPDRSRSKKNQPLTNAERQAKYRERKRNETLRNSNGALRYGVTESNGKKEEKERIEENREDLKEELIKDGSRAPRIESATVEEIYQAYPRKVGKQKAITAIKNALKIETPEVLLDAVKEFAQATNGANEQFIPHPATWFGQHRWKDDRSDWSRVGRDARPKMSSGLGETGQYYPDDGAPAKF